MLQLKNLSDGKGGNKKAYFLPMALFILAFTIIGCAQSGTEPSIEQIQRMHRQ